MKIHFKDIFSVTPNGISPRTPMRIRGVVIGPGITFGGGVSFGGINLGQYVNNYLEIEQTSDGLVELIGIYN